MSGASSGLHMARRGIGCRAAGVQTPRALHRIASKKHRSRARSGQLHALVRPLVYLFKYAFFVSLHRYLKIQINFENLFV